MKKNIFNILIAIACFMSFNALFSAANGEPESMEELNRRYQAAQALFQIHQNTPSSSSQPSHEASSYANATADEMPGRTSSSTLFDDPGTRKRTQREEKENQGEAPKAQRIIEHPGELAEESNELNRARHREQFFQALAQHNSANAIYELEQFIHYEGNPNELINTPEFDTFLRSSELLQYIRQTVSDLASNPDDLHKLQTVYRFSAQNPELQDRLKYALQHLLLFVGSNGQATIVVSNLARNALGFIGGMYDLGLLHSPQEQDPLNEPQTVNLPELSSNSLRLLMQFIERAKNLDDANKSLSRGDTTEQRAFKTAQLNKLNVNVVTLFADLTIQNLQELIHTATYLGLSKPFYPELLNRILILIRRKFEGNFNLLESLPLYMKKALAAASIQSRPNPPTQPAIATNQSPLFSTGLDTWSKNTHLFNLEKSWRTKYLKVSIPDLIAQNKTPAITSAEGRNVLNLKDGFIKSLEGLADIPGIETVEELNLAGHYLEELPANAFSALPNLKILNLSGETDPKWNYQTMIPPLKIDINAFRGLKKLEALNLDNNALTNSSINLNTFNHLPALRYLHAKRNHITPAWRNKIHDKIKKVTGQEPTITWW